MLFLQWNKCNFICFLFSNFTLFSSSWKTCQLMCENFFFLVILDICDKRNAPKIIVKFAIFSKNHVLTCTCVIYCKKRKLGSWITYSSSLLGVAKCYKIRKNLNTTTRTDFMYGNVRKLLMLLFIWSYQTVPFIINI